MEAGGLGESLFYASPLLGGFPTIRDTFGGSHNKDYSIWDSIMGSPFSGELHCTRPPKDPCNKG